MRAVLLDWMMEVCEVYQLRRSTYYLAVDYVDRYLTINPNAPKKQLQLIGITAVYIATKFDEIYAPKINEFAYVCDGACSVTDILRCEKMILNALSWDINPMTPTSWLNLFMQMHCGDEIRGLLLGSENEQLLYSGYSAIDFVKASYLIDLFSLDPCFLLYRYNTTAAAAIYYLYGKAAALRVSGLQWKDIESCVEYIAVFYAILRNASDPKLDCVPSHKSTERRDCATFNFIRHRYPDTIDGENHAIQTHAVNLDYLEKASILRIRRMGYRVTKKLNKTNKSSKRSSKTNKQNSQTKQNDACKQDEQLVLFEIERDSSPIASSHDGSCFDAQSGSESEVNYEFFDCKSQFTFDELLEGIHDCTVKKIVVPNGCNDTDKENHNKGEVSD